MTDMGIKMSYKDVTDGWVDMSVSYRTRLTYSLNIL
jgi:hypothetical protein